MTKDENTLMFLVTLGVFIMAYVTLWIVDKLENKE